MNAIIVDDENSGRQTLRNALKAYCPGITICGEAHNVASAVTILSEQTPDLVFLDVEMPDGQGFDVLEKLTSRDFSVIFVTAYDQYALQAFRHSAVDYLLKPLDPQQLIEAVERVKNQQQTSAPQVDLLLEMLKSKTPSRLALPSSKGIQMINIDEIVRCESENNYTTFFLENGTKILVTRTIKEYDTLLAPHGFCRVHQSHLVSLKNIKEYVRGDGGYVILEDGVHIDVSRRKKAVLLEMIGQV